MSAWFSYTGRVGFVLASYSLCCVLFGCMGARRGVALRNQCFENHCMARLLRRALPKWASEAKRGPHLVEAIASKATNLCYPRETA